MIQQFYLVFEGPGRELHPILETNSTEHLCYVIGGRPRGDDELFRDLPVRVTAKDQR